MYVGVKPSTLQFKICLLINNFETDRRNMKIKQAKYFSFCYCCDLLLNDKDSNSKIYSENNDDRKKICCYLNG